MQFERRENASRWLYILVPISSIAISLFLASFLIVWADQSVVAALIAIFRGGFSSTFALTETLARATPLIFTGLAATIAFRAKFWNIGAEGQLYAGALAATWVGTGLVEMNSYTMIPFLFAMGAVAGGLVLLIPVILKTRLAVDEVVTTLLLNFVILLFVSYCVEGPLKDPMSLGWPQAAPIVDAGVLSPLIPRTRLHAGVLVAVVAAILFWFYLRYTRSGFEIRATGLNTHAARFAGISTHWTVLKVALLSGGIAGMAGVSEVAGLKGYLTLDLSPGFGYTGIAVAMLAGLHPLGVIASAVFIAGMYVGADSMSRVVSVPSYIADIIVALAVLCALVGLMICRYRIRWKQKTLKSASLHQ